MKRLFVLLPLVLMLAACGNKEIILFKGIELGKPNARNSLAKLCSEEKLEDNCVFTENPIQFSTTFGKFKNDMFKYVAPWPDAKYDRVRKGGSYVTPFFTLNDKDEIASIKIERIETSSILESVPLLEEKYGKPEIETNTVRNGFGSEFEKKLFKWKDPQGNTLRVLSMDEKVNEGTIIFLSAAVEAKVTAETKQKERTAKSNL